MILHTFDEPIEPEAIDAIDAIAAAAAWHAPLLGLAGSGECAFLPDTHWLSGVVFHYGSLANAKSWKLDIVGSSAVQFCRLQPGAEHPWHSDSLSLINLNGIMRKLTVVIDMQEQDAYTGGNLQILATEQGSRERIKTLSGRPSRGTVHVFPSTIPFRTTPVAAGARAYLVGWLLGPELR